MQDSITLDENTSYLNNKRMRKLAEQLSKNSNHQSKLKPEDKKVMTSLPKIINNKNNKFKF